MAKVAAKVPEAAHVLIDFKPQHDFFVGIDSDGCAFDAWSSSTKSASPPRSSSLGPAGRLQVHARACEFVNLYSTTRGLNRWIALTRVFDLLRERPEVKARNAKVPEGDKIKEFIASGYPLSHKGMVQYAADHPRPGARASRRGRWPWTRRSPTWCTACPPSPGCARACRRCRARST